MADRFEPTPVPPGNGRHDIGDNTRAAIFHRLHDDFTLAAPWLTAEQRRHLAMLAAASTRALLHELGTLRGMESVDVGISRANQLRDAVCAILSSTGKYPHDIPMNTRRVMEPRDLSDEQWREYDFGGRVYRIENPRTLWIGTTTHRVLDAAGVVHCAPAPGHQGCVLRWEPRDAGNPVQF